MTITQSAMFIVIVDDYVHLSASRRASFFNLILLDLEESNHYKQRYYIVFFYSLNYFDKQGNLYRGLENS